MVAFFLIGVSVCLSLTTKLFHFCFLLLHMAQKDPFVLHFLQKGHFGGFGGTFSWMGWIGVSLALALALDGRFFYIDTHGILRSNRKGFILSSFKVDIIRAGFGFPVPLFYIAVERNNGIENYVKTYS